jgi:predicted phage terminase large subunit-like protein
MLSRAESNIAYGHILAMALKEGPASVQAATAELGKRDLFFLLTKILKRPDINRDWLYDRCREVEQSPDNHLDLWAREHYKSTIITFGLTIQEIINNPEITVGIFSHTRPIAKSFLKQIKREFEENQLLKQLYPDVLYANPRAESISWSEDGGLIVKRKTNPKEATIEAWGLVDGQPTSRHFSLLIYDDVVVKESVTTPEMIHKTTESLALSYNLGASGGRRRFIGTRYHYNDTYTAILDRGTAIPRIYPATDNGKPTGNPVLISADDLAKKYNDMGAYVFNCQMLQDPVADGSQGFLEGWLRYWDCDNNQGFNNYILVDPANSQKKNSDYTVMWVIGLGGDGNYYITDLVRDRLNLRQRTEALIELHKHYRPLGVGYEQYGMQSDIEHINAEMERINYRFYITPLGGKLKKEERIKALMPLFELGKIYLPKVLQKRNNEGKVEELINIFIKDEYKAFPFSAHDDMLDCMARVIDKDFSTTFPFYDYDTSDDYDNRTRCKATGY